MSMTTREKAKHIDAFKYWCDTNEENGVIALPKFLCEHIIDILDDNKKRPHGEWIKSDNKYKGEWKCSVCEKYASFYNNPYKDKSDFCPNCGADMRGDAE